MSQLKLKLITSQSRKYPHQNTITTAYQSSTPSGESTEFPYLYPPRKNNYSYSNHLTWLFHTYQVTFHIQYPVLRVNYPKINVSTQKITSTPAHQSMYIYADYPLLTYLPK